MKTDSVVVQNSAATNAAAAGSSNSNNSVITGVQLQHNNSNNNSRGQTPDWIRDIFHHAKRGNREKLVSMYIDTYISS